ncbi:hypothetical protein ES703_01651 [subsurface metagenome]
MYQRVVSDDDVVAYFDGQISRPLPLPLLPIAVARVHDGVVLDTRVSVDPDTFEIRPHDSSRPNTRVCTYCNVTYYRGGRVDEGSFVNAGFFSTKFN